MSYGKNNFRFNVFSHSEWSAPTMVFPSEIRNALNSYSLVGRKIKDIRTIGLNYTLRREYIEDAAYNALPEDMPEEERQAKSDYENISPLTELPRQTEIDEPLLIRFEDNDIFEIDTPQVPEFRFSMNCIPWNIEAGTNDPNVDTNVLFSHCIGKKITEVAVDTYSTTDYHTFERAEHVSRIVLWLEGDIGLKISTDFDYCVVTCIDRNDNPLPITFGKLKPALYNREDIETDSVVGYTAVSSAFHFGDIGERNTKTPYYSIVPSTADTSLHIYTDDFDLFLLSMDNAIEDFGYDEGVPEEFSYSQWFDILDEACKILTIPTFDELFDYLSSSKYGLEFMNYHGAEFWKNKNKYIRYYNAMAKWTTLVLKPGGIMTVYGF